jgi:hypothetical protein
MQVIRYLSAAAADRQSAHGFFLKRHLPESRHELRLGHRHPCPARAARRRGGNAVTRLGCRWTSLASSRLVQDIFPNISNFSVRALPIVTSVFDFHPLCKRRL